MSFFSDICKHDEVEEHNILRLLERSRNCELIGGELCSANDKRWKLKINIDIIILLVKEFITLYVYQMTNLSELSLSNY